MTTEERPTRYWGVIIFSLLWALVMIGFNSVGGSGQAGIAVTVLWLWVAYYAFRGDVEGIRSLTKFVLFLQVVVGIGIYFYLKGNDTAQAMFGMTPEVLLLSMAIPICAWFGMFLWARITLAKMLPEDIGKGDSAHPMESVASADARGAPQAVRLTSDDAVTATHPDPGKETIEKENGRAGTNTDAAPSNQIAPQYEKDPRSLTKDCESDQGAEVPIPATSDYVIAKTVIEYNEEARGYWEDLGRLPEEYQDRFLQMLDASPKGDPRQMYDDVCAAHEAKTRPYEDREANDALEEMRSISTDAEAEFIRVYDLLGGTVPIADLVDKISEKFTQGGSGEDTPLSSEEFLPDEGPGTRQAKADEVSSETAQQTPVSRNSGRNVPSGRKERDWDIAIIALILAVVLWVISSLAWRTIFANLAL